MNHSVLIGVGGGVAAYKCAILVSRLVQRGHRVQVVLTAAARQFIAPATFAALTGRPVAEHLFDPAFPLGAHIALAEGAEILCVAPATANLMAKMSLGLADDLLSTLYLAFDGPVVAAPAMNTAMWNKAAVQRAVAQLCADGVQFVDPQEGWLSCRTRGVGRMAEPETILAAIETP